MIAKKKAGAKDVPGSDAKDITLPRIDVRVVEVPVKGVSSLIVHAWGEKAKRQMREKQQKQARMPKEAKDPSADFKAAKYLDAAGRDCVPAGAFRNAIVSAGRFADGIPMTRITGSVFFLDDLVPLTFKECVQREDMVRVGGKGPGTGTADLRYRPEYVDWKATLRIQYNANVISIDELLNLIQLAGFSVGICEWRPEKKGQHGRFDIDGPAKEVRAA